MGSFKGGGAKCMGSYLQCDKTGGSMFDNKLFEEWLDKEVAKAYPKLDTGEPLKFEEILILYLKSQTEALKEYKNRTKP